MHITGPLALLTSAVPEEYGCGASGASEDRRFQQKKEPAKITIIVNNVAGADFLFFLNLGFKLCGRFHLFLLMMSIVC